MPAADIPSTTIKTVEISLDSFFIKPTMANISDTKQTTAHKGYTSNGFGTGKPWNMVTKKNGVMAITQRITEIVLYFCFILFKLFFHFLITPFAQMPFLDHSALVRRWQQDAAEFGQFLLALVADGFDHECRKTRRAATTKSTPSSLRVKYTLFIFG